MGPSLSLSLTDKSPHVSTLGYKVHPRLLWGLSKFTGGKSLARVTGKALNPSLREKW